jgi:hypothetical protein
MKIKLPEMGNPEDWEKLGRFCKALGARPPRRDFAPRHLDSEIANILRALQNLKSSVLEASLKAAGAKTLVLAYQLYYSIKQNLDTLTGAKPWPQK